MLNKVIEWFDLKFNGGEYGHGRYVWGWTNGSAVIKNKWVESEFHKEMELEDLLELAEMKLEALSPPVEDECCGGGCHVEEESKPEACLCGGGFFGHVKGVAPGCRYSGVSCTCRGELHPDHVAFGAHCITATPFGHPMFMSPLKAEVFTGEVAISCGCDDVKGMHTKWTDGCKGGNYDPLHSLVIRNSIL